MTDFVAVKEVPPALFVAATLDEVTIPEIPTIARNEVDQMLESLEAAGGASTSPVTFIYHGADGKRTTRFRLTLAAPLLRRPAGSIAPYEVLETVPFRCVAVDYVGDMPGIQRGYDRLFAEVAVQGLTFTGESREVYKKWIGYESPDNVTELQLGVA